MDKNINAILEQIEINGFEAYIVGGYVRDFIRGIKSTDIDICTNALPKDLKLIFPNGKIKNDEYGSYKLITDKYNVDITTYRKDLKYNKRRPVEIEYVNNLLVDIERRDFTINSLCMNKDGKIIDLLNGLEDIKNRRIRIIGNVDQKLKEDPLRMLRAIRFGIVLDYEIDDEIINFILKNKSLIATLSSARKKYELECILISANVLKGLDFLKELDLLSVLDINFNSTVYVEDICGMWAQIEVLKTDFFSKDETRQIEDIRKIIKYGKIDNEMLFEYGLYSCTVAGKVLGYNALDINEKYKNMPIRNIKDIDITALEIITLLEIEPSKIIKDILEDLKKLILNNVIINKKSVIVDYVNLHREVWNLEKSN